MEFEVFTVGPLTTNCYALWEGNEAYIIDPGGNDLDKVISFIKTKGLRVKYILATHGHFDHVMGVERLRKEFNNVKFLIHKDDEELVKKAKELSRYFGIGYDFEVPRIDAYLPLGEVDGIKVIHTPGHSLGSVCFLVDDKYLFSGDTLFKGTVGRVDLGGNAELLFASLEKLKLLKDDIIVLPGHGEITTIGEEKRNNPFMNGSITLQDIAI